jgi:hypothetical protein
LIIFFIKDDFNNSKKIKLSKDKLQIMMIVQFDVVR